MCAIEKDPRESALLPVITVELDQDPPIKLNTVLDTGSQHNFISQPLTRRLQLRTKPNEITIVGITGSQTNLTHTVDIPIKTAAQSTITITAFVTPHLPKVQRLHYDQYEPSTNTVKDATTSLVQTDLLLNGPAMHSIETKQSKIAKSNLLHITSTIGNGIAGYSKGSRDAIALLASRPLYSDLARLFSWDSIGISTSPDDEEQAEDVLANEMLFRNLKYENNQYTVPLLFKPDHPPLGTSRPAAKVRLLAQERKMRVDAAFHEAYHTAVNSAIERGDAIPTQQDDQNDGYYIPHSLVSRPDKDTTKHRLVFDASAKTSSGKSLNDILLNPKVTNNSIPTILLNFRQRPVALSADVSKMFLNFKLHESEQKYHKFLWRDGPHLPLQTYQLTTMTFGIAESPYKANAVTQHHVDKHKDACPKGASALQTSLYVDDLITSADSVEDAKQIIQEATTILDSASLPLRKWTSNNKDALQDLPADHKASEQILPLTSTNECPTKALGIEWHTESDTLRFSSTTLPTLAAPTMTEVASAAAKL